MTILVLQEAHSKDGVGSGGAAWSCILSLQALQAVAKPTGWGVGVGGCSQSHFRLLPFYPLCLETLPVEIDSE